METVVNELSEIQDTPAALGVMSGSCGTGGDLLLRRFTRGFGSPNYLELAANFGRLPVDAFSAMHGEYLGVGYDLADAGFVLSFGADWLQVSPSPVEASRAYAELRRSRLDMRVRVVQIEPRLSVTGGKADEWVPIRPGTEGALALGMAHVMIDEGLVDSRFIEQSTFGFDDWTGDDGTHHLGFRNKVLQEYSPEAVAEIANVPADVVHRLAIEFGKSRRPLAIGTRGRLLDQMAIHSLNALAGNIRIPDGTSRGAGTVLDFLAQDNVPVADAEMPIDDGFNRRLGHSAPSKLPAALLGEDPYDLRVLMLSRANPAFVGPDVNRWMQALRRIPFIVSFTSFMDDTAEYADVILPTHCTLESRVAWAGCTIAGTPSIKTVSPVVEPFHDTREFGPATSSSAKSCLNSPARRNRTAHVMPGASALPRGSSSSARRPLERL